MSVKNFDPFGDKKSPFVLSVFADGLHHILYADVVWPWLVCCVICQVLDVVSGRNNVTKINHKINLTHWTLFPKISVQTWAVLSFIIC